MSIRKTLIAAFVVSLAYAAATPAKTAQEVRAACRAEGRPCVGLVLSGGGARGFAHVGVLKALEEMGVKIDVVTGTSMGSMVGGAYAAGFSADEVEETVVGVDWDRMLATRAPREGISWRQKADDYSGLPNGSLQFNLKGEIKLPEEVVPSQELELFLMDKVGAWNDVKDLSTLPIPFAAPATDLVTGERVVMRECSLREAMRASMSVPAAFAPMPWKDTLLVDGGLVDNLPVALARQMGADVVIAVNVGTPLAKKNDLTSIFAISAQMVNLLTEQNVRQSIASLTDRDILIEPDLHAFTSADLKQSRAIIAAGYEAAEALKGKLSKYAVKKADWLKWDEARLASASERMHRHEFKLAGVKVEGLKYVSPEAVLRTADLPEKGEVSTSQIAAASRRLYSTGDFSSVGYHFEPGPEGSEVLVFEPKEAGPGRSTLRFGGSVETDFQSSNTFNLVLAHDWSWLNDWGGEWRNEIHIGEHKLIKTEFMQPLGAGSPWFVMPRLSYRQDDFDVYHNGVAASTWGNKELAATFQLGYTISDLGYAAIGTGYARRYTTQLVGEAPPDDEESTPIYTADLYLDTLDNAAFPTKGFRFVSSIEWAARESGSVGGHHTYSMEALLPYTRGLWTLRLNALMGRSTREGFFKLGGVMRLSGSPVGRWAGSDMQFASLSLSRNLSDYFTVMGRPVWSGGYFELGRAWNRNLPETVDGGEEDWRGAVSFYVGLDSLFGPLYLVFGKTYEDSAAVYFRWGYQY